MFASHGTIQTSDENEKTNIHEFDERYEKAFLEFQPVLYMWKNLKPTDDHDRIHSGFIAQQIEEVCKKHGLSSESFAAICKGYLDEPTEDGRNVVYGLNYGQFISLNTHMIQKQHTQIEKQQAQIDELQTQIIKQQKQIEMLLASK